MTPFYRRIYKVFAGLVRWFYNVRIIGAENEPEDGGYIACSNHLSNSDVVIVAASLKRQVRYFAKAELFKVPGLKQLITALGAFPVQRGKGDVASIKNTIKLLDGGEVVGFYPQGHRFPGVDPRTTEPKNGVGLIVYRSQTPALPICLQTKGWKIRPFKRITVTIGKPVYPSELGFTDGDRAEYETAAREIFRRITAMVRDEDAK